LALWFVSYLLNEFFKINKVCGMGNFMSMFLYSRDQNVSASIIPVAPIVTTAVHCTISFHGVLELHLMEHNVNRASVMDMPPAVDMMLL
jgi:hypothetical protein